jgi:hypothetical protein
MARRDVFQLQSSPGFQPSREHLDYHPEPRQCRPNQLSEAVQPSSCQLLRYLREVQWGIFDQNFGSFSAAIDIYGNCLFGPDSIRRRSLRSCLFVTGLWQAS